MIEVPKSFHLTIDTHRSTMESATLLTSLKFYTLVDQNGNVVAQHDGFPVNGYRHMVGAREYVRDLHGLLLPLNHRWNTISPRPPQSTKWERILLADGGTPFNQTSL